MKKKHRNRLMHITMNTGAVQSCDYLDRQLQNRINEWIFPIINAGEGKVPGYEDLKVTIELLDGFAIFQIIYADKTLVASNCVAWTKGGSEEAWEVINCAYSYQAEVLRDLGFPDLFPTPVKPIPKRWIATLVGASPWDDALLRQGDLVALLIQFIGMAILDFNRQATMGVPNTMKIASFSVPFMKIINNGEEILSSDYFGSDIEQAGNFLVSCNKGAIRLMWPRCRRNEIKDMMTAKEIIVTKGTYRQGDGLEILFDDHSDNPYALHMTNSAILSLMPGDPGEKQWKLSVWIWDDGRPRMVFDSMTYWRKGKILPDLRPLCQHTGES